MKQIHAISILAIVFTMALLSVAESKKAVVESAAVEEGSVNGVGAYDSTSGPQANQAHTDLAE